jgi:hypothetical protein
MRLGRPAAAPIEWPYDLVGVTLVRRKAPKMAPCPSGGEEAQHVGYLGWCPADHRGRAVHSAPSSSQRPTQLGPALWRGRRDARASAPRRRARSPFELARAASDRSGNRGPARRDVHVRPSTRNATDTPDSAVEHRRVVLDRRVGASSNRGVGLRGDGGGLRRSRIHLRPGTTPRSLNDAAAQRRRLQESDKMTLTLCDRSRAR